MHSALEALIEFHKNIYPLMNTDEWYKAYLFLEGLITGTWLLTVSKPGCIAGEGILTTRGTFRYRFLPDTVAEFGGSQKVNMPGGPHFETKYAIFYPLMEKKVYHTGIYKVDMGDLVLTWLSCKYDLQVRELLSYNYCHHRQHRKARRWNWMTPNRVVYERIHLTPEVGFSSIW